MFDVDDLETFVAVADAGGVSAAARRLGVAKSIVSRKLSRLETSFGAQLLARTTRGAALTEAGVILRDHAARVIAELDSAREAILPTGELRGRLRIAAPLSFSAQLAPVIAELGRRHPLLHIHTSYADNFVDLVSGGFDAGIRVGYLADSSLVARKIGPVRGYLVASPDYLAEYGSPLSPQDLHQHEALTQETEVWRLVVDQKTIVIHPQGRFKADNGAALAAAAIAGLGIAALPGFLVEDHLASGALIALLPECQIPEPGIFVVRPPGAQASRKVKVLTEVLQEFFAQKTPS
jgi:DNA-binding transcriptional LysR family regulator